MSISKRVKTGLLGGVFLLLAASTALALVGYERWKYETRVPYRGYLEPERAVDIPRGATIATIGRRLEDAGVIRSAAVFTWYCRLHPGPPLQAGRYRFATPLTLPEVVEKLRRGEVWEVQVSIPEGADLVQIAVILKRRGLAEIGDFMVAAARRELIADLDPAAGDLEGYLMPDTYRFLPGTPAAEIVGTMVANFRRRWTSEFEARRRELGWSLREIVTLASLIEKETGVPEERPLVSAVFHNRLRLGMRLMCDPTVIYAVRLQKEFDGVIHRSDLQLDSPYNTYLYPGLPPGPICNPGAAALEAALFPAAVDYLYFVADNRGGHVFSRTYAEHARAVQRYRR
ncbi:MAG: endolytic transglycosylase MltG [Acidobacteriota bacterium]